MEKIVKTSLKFRDHFEGAFWNPENELRNEILTINHILPCMMLLAGGLFLAILAIIPELLLGHSNMSRGARPTTNNSNVDTTDNSNVDSGINLEESKEESMTRNLTRKGALELLEPNTINKPEMESSEEKEQIIVKDKGKHHTITVVAEIHDALTKKQVSMRGFHDETNTVTSTQIITPKLYVMDGVSPCETVVNNGNTSVVGEKAKLNANLSREGSAIRNSPQWSEIIEVLDNEWYTTGSFLDEATISREPTPMISQGFDVSSYNDSRRSPHSHTTIDSPQWSGIVKVQGDELQKEAVNITPTVIADGNETQTEG